jgi:hypothetical protein
MNYRKRAEDLRRALEKIAYGFPHKEAMTSEAQRAIREDDLKYGVPIRIVVPVKEKKTA